MTSKIMVEIDFDTMQPLLRIKQDLNSEILADKTLQHFIQKASNGGTLYVSYPEYSDRKDNSVVEIRCQTSKVVEVEEPALPSRFQIGDKVDFTTTQWIKDAFEKEKSNRPDVVDTDLLEYTPHYGFGTIVAIKFTEAKVWYDVLDDYTGKVVEDLDSSFVKVLVVHPCPQRKD